MTGTCTCNICISNSKFINLLLDILQIGFIAKNKNKIYFLVRGWLQKIKS